MPGSNPLDHRNSSDEQLVVALRDRDALAFAEAYHRTVGAAHACGRRLLASSSEIERLLHAVYADLWERPPGAGDDVMLEGWVRRRCFELASDELHRQGRAPTSPSASTLLPDLPAPQRRTFDPAEDALATLDEPDREVLLQAHDRGLGSAAQETADAGRALRRSLLALSGEDAADETVDSCRVDALADWVLGVVSRAEADAIARHVAIDASCAALARTLRRGRRRLEGLPPTPDMGHRIIAAVLSGARSTTPVMPDSLRFGGSGGRTGAAAGVGDADAAAAPADTAATDADPDEVAAETPATDVTRGTPPVVLPDLDQSRTDRQPSGRDDARVFADMFKDDRGPGVGEDSRADDGDTIFLTGAYAYPEDDEPGSASRVAIVVGFLVLLALGGAVGMLFVGPLIQSWLQ